jgi:hypothetical protein
LPPLEAWEGEGAEVLIPPPSGAIVVPWNRRGKKIPSRGGEDLQKPAGDYFARFTMIVPVINLSSLQ